jgi:hypothetical protein
MSKILAKFIIIALLFVSAEAAICGVHHMFDSHDDIVHIDSSDDLSELFEINSCGHMCHCAHHFATFVTDIAFSVSKSDQMLFDHTSYYPSGYSPPLYRPPIA